MISLCMIVKNEGKHLEKSLDSIVNYIEDIVIVDTGSTDNTKEIARRYTNKVYDFKWCNDFSKARNFSISKAANDWVLILDADEVIYKFDKKNIERFIKNNKMTVGRIKRINPFEEGEEIKKYIERVNRLFNKKYFHYQGIIHEQVVSKDGSEYKMNSIEIEANHIGYLNEVINGTNKLERNINLLIDAIKNNPLDPYLYYQIGKSYYRKKDYAKAYDSFVKSIQLSKDFKFEYTEDLIESYGYTLIKCEKYEKAMELKKYRIYYDKSPDYNFVMGLIYMNNGKFQESVEHFQKCIGEREGKIEGINSYQPNYNIGVIYEILGFKEVALEFYNKCQEYLPAKQRVKIMIEEKKEKMEKLKSDIQRHIQDGNLYEAKILIEESFNIKDNDIEVYSMKSVVEIMENRIEDAQETLESALKIDDKNFDILYNLGYLYEIKKKYKLAVDFYSKALIESESEEIKIQLEEYIRNIKIKFFKTSIIILTYNNLDYNKICIESIKKYTNNNYEIIVVDNQSTDGTVEWLKTQNYIRVIYNKENLGFPKGCNQGISIATGEEILLLNNDTIVTPKWLENLKECLYSSESIGAVGSVTNSCPNYQTIPTDYASVEEMIQFAEKYNENEPKKWEERLRLIGYCMLIKKDVIDKIGLLDERFTPGNFEDDDYSFRIRNAGYKLMLCKNSFIHHFGSLSFEKKSNKYNNLLDRNRRKFFEKWLVDPYDIINIEKEVSDIIVENLTIDNPKILHLNCSGGATLLRIKNEYTEAKLYGVEKRKELILNTDSFAVIKDDLLELMNNLDETKFDFIIVSENNYNDFKSSLNSIDFTKYLNDDGTVIFSILEEDKNLFEKIYNELKELFSFVEIKEKKQEFGYTVIVSNLINSIKGDRAIQMKSEYLSIVLTIAKNDQHIEACIKDINRWATKENSEIIVINYGDNEKLGILKEKFDNVKILEADDSKVYGSNINSAIMMAKGRDILFIHSDVSITSNSVKLLKKALYSSEEIGAVGPVNDTQSYNIYSKELMNDVKDGVCSSNDYEERIKLDDFCILVKKELFIKCGGFSELYMTDICTINDFLFRIRNSGKKLILCKKAYVHHYEDYHLLGSINDAKKKLSEDEDKFKSLWGFNIGYSSLIREEVIDLINNDEDKKIRVLEIGCACGATLLQIKNKFKNAELHGIELNENAAKIAKLCANVTAENIENNVLSYEEGYFDYIIFADVLEHLKKPWRVLENIKKYLKSDGKILASIPNVMHYSVISGLLNQRWEYKDWGILDRTHYRFFTFKEIEDMFKDSGYKIIQVENKCFIENNEDISFIEALVNLTEEDFSLQYKTIQYIIKATKN